jgi:hypothetical protein
MFSISCESHTKYNTQSSNRELILDQENHAYPKMLRFTPEGPENLEEKFDARDHRAEISDPESLVFGDWFFFQFSKSGVSSNLLGARAGKTPSGKKVLSFPSAEVLSSFQIPLCFTQLYVSLSNE